MADNNYSTELNQNSSSENGGYGDSNHGNAGQSKHPYGSSECAYSSSSYGGSVLDGSDSTESGAYGTDQFQDGYSENPYEVNVFDTPYSESASNPNPQGGGYGDAQDDSVKRRSTYRPHASDYGDDDQLVL
jgi:hypothetical protein